MESVGFLAPETAAAARTEYERCETPARELVREIAIAMGLDDDSYDDRVTDSVIATAQDAFFGSLLRVHTGTVSEFEAWRSTSPYESFSVSQEGSEHVDGRAWHSAPCAERIAAVTFNEEREAAISTVRRQAYGRIYRDVLEATGE